MHQFSTLDEKKKMQPMRKWYAKLNPTRMANGAINVISHYTFITITPPIANISIVCKGKRDGNKNKHKIIERVAVYKLQHLYHTIHVNNDFVLQL